MPAYYDIVLGIIPVTFVGIVGAASLVGIATPTAASIASVLTAGFLAHAMFINPPTGQRSQSSGNQSRASSRPIGESPNAPAEFAD